ncbi:hypothetical protein D9M69_732150 [compost metagenome]
MQRDLLSHGFQGDRVLVHQGDVQAMSGGGQGGGEPRRACADDEDIGLVPDRRRLASYRCGVVVERLLGMSCHRIPSLMPWACEMRR